MNWHPDRPPMLWHEPWWHTWQALIPILLILILGGVAIWLLIGMKRMQAAAAGPGAATPTGPPVPAPTDAALAHARMRYANGEIDRDAFLAIWADLGGAPPTGGAVATPALDGDPAPDGA
jgi:hypothetical protein